MVLNPKEAIATLQKLITRPGSGTPGQPSFIPKGLQPAEDDFIKYWNANPGTDNFAEEDVLAALRELQKSPLDYILVILNNFSAVQPQPTQENLLVAVNLIQTYLRSTSSLEAVLKKLIDSFMADGSKTTAQNVIVARHELEKALVIIQTEPGLAEGEVDLDVLRQASEAILKLLNSGNIPRSQIRSQFIAHLAQAKVDFERISTQDFKLNAVQLQDIQDLIGNWEKIVAKLQESSTDEKLNDINTSRPAIAQSIKIHDYLEEIYSYIAEAIRGSDLLSPAIL